MVDCVTVGTDLATELPDLGFFILLPINFRCETDLHLFVGNLDITRCSPCLVLDHVTKAMRRASHPTRGDRAVLGGRAVRGRPGRLQVCGRRVILVPE